MARLTRRMFGFNNISIDKKSRFSFPAKYRDTFINSNELEHVRNIKKSLPYNCREIYQSGFKLLFHKKKFVTAKLLKCE